MSVVNKIGQVISEFSSKTPNPDDLHRLDAFFKEMKRIGIAKKPEYRIRRPDTLGRVSPNISTK
ncbi:hypothetical protein Desti_1423 [Desulfomonile tiedjei DSM 6799]|uniref:Uncharacterized protein n=1 Tax=Desulfomonile tiedjei (strain ATCC 49306 / DSM 6799 / DCB-1) TaxID=706587 RepID=I4C3J4_DESTA|nr:hypothetical protein Desti_1423 [Desulfomonile tiedjei DSM 6799]